ncbi:hypothetical protein GCM10007425_01630 [Lysinibacillus alkalisoli]|uniref:Uncharacterized protein n=1 Tax=Lysinibacillus alkalisoli TaxID=1911548 RepID=A0A917D454_9BACI|nr:hypothetical protein [Lysinibacillus alkalisoli]GGG10989.1 hypothetical protein GCM10007425_01630 [Lysinibacillus alkalisoli]
MQKSATETTNVMILNLLVQILEERGIMTDKELKERLMNQVKLSKTMDETLKTQVMEEITNHH